MITRNKLYYCSTPFGLTMIACMINDEQAKHYRILVIANNNSVPELKRDQIVLNSVNSQCAAMFDRIVFLNDLIFPLHPHDWNCDGNQAHASGSLFRACLGKRTIDDLFVETLTSAPALTLANILQEAEIHVFGEGLMVYGPSRVRLPRSVGRRIADLTYLDIVRGLDPLLLSEFSPRLNPVDAAVFTSQIGNLYVSATRRDSVSYDDACVVLGQYLSALDILTVDQENELYASLIQKLKASGEDNIIFRAHPSVPRTYTNSLKYLLQKRFLTVTFCHSATPLESILLWEKPKLVCGLFSTGLATASTLFNIPAYSSHSLSLLRDLRPFQNSNRIPALLSHILFPDLNAYDGKAIPVSFDASRARRLVTPTAYAMQPSILSQLRPDAVAYTREVVQGPDEMVLTRTVKRTVLGEKTPIRSKMSEGATPKPAASAAQEKHLGSSERLRTAMTSPPAESHRAPTKISRILSRGRAFLAKRSDR